jgi:hypothetical protein
MLALRKFVPALKVKYGKSKSTGHAHKGRKSIVKNLIL